MKAQQLRAIATTLTATITDKRRITALVTGIRNYSEEILTGYETEAIAKLTAAIELAVSYNADRAFVFQLKGQIKSLKVKIKRQELYIEFNEFKLPYTYVSGTARLDGVVYPFLCYFNAPSCANPARSIDPTFNKSISPVLRTPLRDAVKVALVSAWNSYRYSRIQQTATPL